MGLYKAQLSVGPFKRGEIVDIDETEFSRYIERGWLQKFDEGLLSAPLVIPDGVPLGHEGVATPDTDLGAPDGGSAPSGEPESTEDASDPTSDASPSDLPLDDEATSG